jgi:hypothetical protein
MEFRKTLNQLRKHYLAALLCVVTLCLLVPLGCGGGGGGGGDDDEDDSRGTGLLNVEGTLTTGTRLARVEVGQGDTPVVGVQVCALDGCSTTDGSGQFVLGLTPFEGGEVLFVFSGPGIDESVAYTLPAGEENVTVHFYVTADGAVVPSPEPTPTASPGPTSTPEPGTSVTPTPTSTPVTTATATPTPAPTDSGVST